MSVSMACVSVSMARADEHLLAGCMHVCMYVCMYVFTGTPMAASFAMKDFDLLFDHVVDNFRERLKCTCGAGV